MVAWGTIAGSFVSPNHPHYVFLRSLEALSELVSRPLSLDENQLGRARALLGLLLMHEVYPPLTADMYAMMTCAGIPPQGEIEVTMVNGRRQRKHVHPDPDAAKRKGLRRFLNRLTTAGILKDVRTEYLMNPLNSGSAEFLHQIPPDGIICFIGVINAKKPKGEKTSRTYSLANLQPTPYSNEILSTFVQPERIDPTNIETCRTELSTVYNSLLKLIKANKLRIERTFEVKLQPYIHPDLESAKLRQATYVLACFSKPRGLVRLLPSAVQFTLTTIE